VTWEFHNLILCWASLQHLDEYNALYHDFIAVLESEETARQYPNTYSQCLRENWSTGRIWYILALDSINAFPIIFEQHLRPRFFDKFELATDGVALARLWEEKVLDFIDGKQEDKQRYEERVRAIFAEARARAHADGETTTSEEKHVCSQGIVDDDGDATVTQGPIEEDKEAM